MKIVKILRKRGKKCTVGTEPQKVLRGYEFAKGANISRKHISELLNRYSMTFKSIIRNRHGQISSETEKELFADIDAFIAAETESIVGTHKNAEDKIEEEIENDRAD